MGIFTLDQNCGVLYLGVRTRQDFVCFLAIVMLYAIVLKCFVPLILRHP